MAASPWNPDPYGPPRIRSAAPAARHKQTETQARILVVGERATGPLGCYPGQSTAVDLLRGGAFVSGPCAERLRRIGLESPCAAANLLPWGTAGRWNQADRRAARSSATKLAILSRDFYLVVVCGRQAAGAFGLTWAPLRTARSGHFLMLPHPSGRAGWWNLPDRETQAAAAILRALRAVRAPIQCTCVWCRP